MELWKESLQTALDEHLDAAFAELAESNPAVREAVKQQRDASVLVKDNSYLKLSVVLWCCQW